MPLTTSLKKNPYHISVGIEDGPKAFVYRVCHNPNEKVKQKREEEYAGKAKSKFDKTEMIVKRSKGKSP